MVKRKRSLMVLFFELILAILIGAIVGSFLSKNLIGKSTVQGVSMEPTYSTGDELLMYRLGIPTRGEIATMEHGGLSLIKRVVAIPGDSVKIEDSKLYVNGECLEEDYITEGEYSGGIIEGTSMRLGSGEYFVIGDNRQESMDSRDFGAITEDEFTGVVILELEGKYSFNSIIETIKELIMKEFEVFG